MNSASGDIFFGFLAGVMVMLLIFFVIRVIPGTAHHQIEKVLTECEETLPRDKHCVLSARPAEE